MEQILTAIIQRLEANAVALGLSYIDEEYGQVDMLDEEGRDSYPVTFPCVLVDCAGETWRQIGIYNQTGTANVNLNVYMDCYDDTHANSGTIEKVEERKALVRSITELLQGWKPLADGGVMVRQSTQTSTINHGIKLYQVSFSLPVNEDFSRRERATATPKVYVQLKCQADE